MATLKNQLNKAKKITKNNLAKELFQYIRSIEKEFLDLNKQQIEQDSKDIFGKPIGFYSFGTELASGGKKKAGDPFTGVDTGDWFKGFKMQEVSGVLRFYSTDPKNSEILNSENWLSSDLFGLSDNNLKAIIQERLLPFFLEMSRKKLDL